MLRLGKSSLVVVLPKDWLKELNLKAGDKVTVIQEEDGTLKVAPSSIGSTLGEKKTNTIINIDNCNDENLIERVLVGNYLVGNDYVIITSKKNILDPDYLKSIRKMINKLRGVEIVERTPNKLVLQCVADPVKFTIQNILSRMLSLIVSTLDYIKRGLLEHNKDYLKEVLYIEEEVDRLYWLSVRQILTIQKNRALAKIVGVTSPLHLVGNRTIVKMLEVTSDYLEEVSRDALELEEEKVENAKDIIADISKFIDDLEDTTSDIIRAYNGLDIKIANDVLNYISELEGKGRLIIEKIISNISDVKTGVLLVRILTRLIDMIKSLSIICEIIINRALEEPSNKIPCISVKEFE